MCLGADFAHIGVNLGVLVAVLQPTWPVLGPDWCQLAQLGRTYSQLGANLNQLGANWEPTWINLGSLEPTLSQLGAYLVHFSANLNQLGTILGTKNIEKSMIFIHFRIF